MQPSQIITAFIISVNVKRRFYPINPESPKRIRKELTGETLAEKPGKWYYGKKSIFRRSLAKKTERRVNLNYA